MNDPYWSFSFSFSCHFCLLLLACHIDKKYYFLLRTLSVRSVLLSSHFMFPAPICDALRDLVPFVQLSCRLKPATLLKLTLFHGCFSRFLNCANGTKSRNAPNITSYHCFQSHLLDPNSQYITLLL